MFCTESVGFFFHIQETVLDVLHLPAVVLVVCMPAITVCIHNQT